MLIGSFGLFFTLFLLFCRYLPMVAMAEVKQVLPHDGAHEGDCPGFCAHHAQHGRKNGTVPFSEQGDGPHDE
jgi:hypothetical protein